MKVRDGSFRATLTLKTAKVADSYTKESQLTLFKLLFGKSQKYISERVFMSRGHLTPNADFVFSTHRAATFFLVNAIPQFQSINAGNWLSVEDKTRKLAIQEQTILDIYTGVYGQLFLKKRRSDEKEPISLIEGNKVEVPEYVFKIVHNPNTLAAIVFITSNNPFLRKNELNPFCADVCKKAKMDFNEAPSKGLTFCCEYSTFNAVVRFDSLEVTSLLTFT